MQLISTNQVAAFKPHRPYFPNLIGQTQLRPLLAVGGTPQSTVLVLMASLVSFLARYPHYPCEPCKLFLGINDEVLRP
jgi:hypothetical protein